MNRFARATALCALMVGMLPAAGVTAQEPSQLSETYGAWSVQCGTSATGEGEETERACQVVQEVRQQGTGQRIYLLMVRQPKDNLPVLILVSPFGLLLSEGISLSISEKTLADVPFKTCRPVGCIAHYTMDEAAVAQLKAGDILSLITTTENNQPLTVEMSLNGFTQSYQRLQELQAQ